MITVINDSHWLCCMAFAPNSKAWYDPTFTVHRLGDKVAKIYTYWPVTYFPSPYCTVNKVWDYDAKRNYVETYENILDESLQTFEYEGHTWNNFFHRKVISTITNLPRNFPVRSTAYINQATGDRTIMPEVRDFREPWYYYRDDTNLVGIGTGVHRHVCFMRYWNPFTGRVRVTKMTWFTKQGELVDERGAKLAQGPWPVDTRVRDQFLIRETGAGIDYQYSAETFLLSNPNGPDNTLNMTGYTSGESLFQQFCSLCRVTDSTGDFPVPSWQLIARANRVFNGPGRKLNLLFDRRPNWEGLFPSKQRLTYWPEIAAEAYQDLGMTSINGIANVKELFGMGEAVTGFIKTLKSLPSKRAAAAAQLFLSVHYGFKLTVLDAIELRKTLIKYSEKRSSLSKCTATKSWEHGGISYTATYQVFYDEFAKLKSSLQQLLLISDFALTTENWWDMVPYSFVVDWFIDVGSVLTALDNYYNVTQRHEVICAGKSILESRTLSKSSLGLAADIHCSPIEASCFTRMYQSKAVIPSLIPSVTINPFNHLIEAAALVISRK